MSIIFRPPRANELQPAQELVVCSINDLTDEQRLDTLSGNISFSGVPVTVIGAGGGG